MNTFALRKTQCKLNNILCSLISSLSKQNILGNQQMSKSDSQNVLSRTTTKIKVHINDLSQVLLVITIIIKPGGRETRRCYFFYGERGIGRQRHINISTIITTYFKQIAVGSLLPVVYKYFNLVTIVMKIRYVCVYLVFVNGYKLQLHIVTKHHLR